MLFLQLLAFVFALSFYLNLLMAKRRYELSLSMEKRRVRVIAGAIWDAVSVGAGILAFWLPFAFGWVG